MHRITLILLLFADAMAGEVVEAMLKVSVEVRLKRIGAANSEKAAYRGGRTGGEEELMREEYQLMP